MYFAHFADGLKRLADLFAVAKFLFDEIPILVHDVKAHLLVKARCAEVSEKIDAVAFAVIFPDDVLHQLSGKALFPVVFVGHDGAQLNVVFYDAVLHEPHYIGGNI